MDYPSNKKLGIRKSPHKYPASSIQYPVSSIQYPASSIQYPTSSIQHPESSIQYPASRNGFSLIEVAIAIALLALVLGGVVAVFSQGARAARKTQQQAVAYSLARAVIEQYSNWTSLTILAGNPPGNGQYPRPTIALNNIIYTPTLGIADGPCIILPCPLPNAVLKQLNVTISWTDGATPRDVTITTLKADY